MSTQDEYQLIVKVAPIYPARALASGLEGYVVLEYRVSETGSTENIRVVESSSTLFEAGAIESAKKYKYKPRVVNGQPAAVDGVRTLISFELEDDGPGEDVRRLENDSGVERVVVRGN